MSRVKGRSADAPKHSPAGLVHVGPPLVNPATVAKCGKCGSGYSCLKLDTESAPAMIACRLCGWRVFVEDAR